MKVLQGNLNRSRTAQDLLTQICLEKNDDVVIVSEQYEALGFELSGFLTRGDTWCRTTGREEVLSE